MAEIAPIDPSALPGTGIAIAADDDYECPPGCVLVEIPNGLKVAVGQPPVATYNLLGEIFGDNPNPSSVAMAFAKVCFFIQAIDGVPQSRPTNRTELQVLQNKLLDSGLETIALVVEKYFPQPSATTAKVIKKSAKIANFLKPFFFLSTALIGSRFGKWIH